MPSERPGHPTSLQLLLKNVPPDHPLRVEFERRRRRRRLRRAAEVLWWAFICLAGVASVFARFEYPQLFVVAGAIPYLVAYVVIALRRGAATARERRRRAEYGERLRTGSLDVVPPLESLEAYLRVHPDADRGKLERLAQHEQREEDAMRERVRRLPLPDAAVAYALHRARHPGSPPGVRRASLARMRTDADPGALGEARVRAAALLGDAAHFGDLEHTRWRAERGQGDTPAADAQRAMRAKHPGFTDETYGAVLSRGLFLTR